MFPLTNAQIRDLKAQAQRLKATLKIGKEGISPAFLAALDEVLGAVHQADTHGRRHFQQRGHAVQVEAPVHGQAGSHQLRRQVKLAPESLGRVGEDRPELDKNLKRIRPRPREPQQVPRENEMPGGRHGQEFREPFNEAEDDGDVNASPLKFAPPSLT